MPWHISNTTIRSPYRLRSGLIALRDSSFHGNLLGPENESGFGDLLHETGVVHSFRREQSPTKDRSDLGRKWRVALAQLGFVTYHFTRGHRHGVDSRLRPFVEGIADLTGRPYEITPVGRLLIEADEIVSQQEVFLRALAAYRIPSPLETRYQHSQFSPLLFILHILGRLEERQMEPVISFEEMALIVQRSTANEGAESAVAKIRDLRVSRQDSDISMRQFFRQAYSEAALDDSPTLDPGGIRRRTTTWDDYADLNIRYLKATGLFSSKGRGITVSSERSHIVEHLKDEANITLDDNGYLRQLWQGASLPTDDRPTAIAFVRHLEQLIREKGAEPQTVNFDTLDDQHLRLARHRLEAKLQRIKEGDFAAEQLNQVAEIVDLMDAILARGRKTLADGNLILIPKGETAVYMEWVIWRAFLAIDSLENKPWKARRFDVDQDLLPIGHAPGGGPDMSFVFEDAIVVVEVTLTSSSRQEAAEGEPVRRHVAQYAQDNTTPKEVYGLFIAPTVDTNTAHTFRSGDWYGPNDSKINVHIVPMELRDFRDFFQAILLKPPESARRLRDLLMQCRMEANQDAPQWKRKISELTRRATARVMESA